MAWKEQKESTNVVSEKKLTFVLHIFGKLTFISKENKEASEIDEVTLNEVGEQNKSSTKHSSSHNRRVPNE